MVTLERPRDRDESMPPKLDQKSETERVQLLMPRALVLRIEDWRRKQERLPTLSEAIRKLLESGLRAEGEPEER